MRQVLIAAPHEIRVDDAARPEPGPRELRVRSRAVGICGSDLHAMEGRHPFIDLPVVPGHEVAGVVDAVGGDVEGFAPGDRVLLEPNLVCDECEHCRSGRYNLCERLVVVGCTTSGAMGDAFTAPARRFHHVPDGLSMCAAALVEPLSTATHAVRIAGSPPLPARDAAPATVSPPAGLLAGACVAVLGAGSIGLLTMLAARAAGAAAIAVTDLVPAKRDRAGELGADVVLDPLEAGAVDRIRAGLPHRPDVVFDCVANQSSTDQAIALALKGGTVVVVGVPTGAVNIALPLIQDREVRLQGTAMYVREDVERAIELITGEAVPVDALVTATFPLEKAPEAFAAAASGDHVKVQIAL